MNYTYILLCMRYSTGQQMKEYMKQHKEFVNIILRNDIVYSFCKHLHSVMNE